MGSSHGDSEWWGNRGPGEGKLTWMVRWQSLAVLYRYNMTGKVALGLAMLTLWATVSRAESPPPGEYQVKAAFLYNFAKFVAWPTTVLPETGAFMTLCVLGDDPFGSDLEQIMHGKTVGNRELLIKRFQGEKGLASCHILFISASENKRLPQILAGLKSAHVLTVGEAEPFMKLGGIINFTLEENKIRFAINVDAAERAGLKLSSKLLRLARIFRDRN